jgi:predicted Zn-dependent peptidase
VKPAAARLVFLSRRALLTTLAAMARGCGPLVVLMALGMTSHAAATTRDTPIDLPVQRLVLPNGLTVLLARDRTAPLIGMELRYRVGTRDDPASRPSLAALAQSLMLRATTHLRDGDYDRKLDAAGGFDSAWTTNLDDSIFSVTVPSEEMALPLWLWSEQMGFFAARLDERLIAQQLQWLRNQRVQRYENQPAGRVPDLLMAELFPAGHPYHGGTVRAPGGLEGLTVAELRAFVASHYTPDHALLTLVGDFEPQRARSLIEKYFGSLRPARTPPPRYGTPAGPSGQVRLNVAARVEAPSVAVAWRTPPLFAPGDAELDLIAELMEGDRAGWLRWRLVDEWKIASSVTAHQYSRALGSLFVIDAVASRGHTPAELVTGIDRVLREVQSGPVDRHSMSGALAGHVFDRLFALERRLARADLYAECEQQDVLGHCLESWASRYLTIDAASLSRVATRELPLDRRVVVEVTPTPDAPIAGEVRGRSDTPR